MKCCRIQPWIHSVWSIFSFIPFHNGQQMLPNTDTSNFSPVLYLERVTRQWRNLISQQATFCSQYHITLLYGCFVSDNPMSSLSTLRKTVWMIIYFQNRVRIQRSMVVWMTVVPWVHAFEYVVPSWYTVWEGLGSVALLKKVCYSPESRIWGQRRLIPFPVSLTPWLCLEM